MVVSVRSALPSLARAVGVAEPSDPLAWEGWLQPENDLTVTDVVSFGGLRPDNGGEPRTGHFPAPRAAGTGIEDLDALARGGLPYRLPSTGSVRPRDVQQ